MGLTLLSHVGKHDTDMRESGPEGSTSTQAEDRSVSPRVAEQRGATSVPSIYLSLMFRDCKAARDLRIQACSPAVALLGCKASCCLGHCICNVLREGLGGVSNAQADDLSIRVGLLVRTSPLCDLRSQCGCQQDVAGHAGEVRLFAGTRGLQLLVG